MIRFIRPRSIGTKPASLEAGKLYEVVPDAQAEKHGLIRVVDESGEDYGYSAERFFVLDVPHALEKALKGISPKRQPNITEAGERREFLESDKRR